MFQKSKFSNLQNNLQDTPRYKYGCGRLTFMVIVPNQWIEQKATQMDWQKPSLRIMKNG